MLGGHPPACYATANNNNKRKLNSVFTESLSLKTQVTQHLESFGKRGKGAINW